MTIGATAAFYAQAGRTNLAAPKRNAITDAERAIAATPGLLFWLDADHMPMNGNPYLRDRAGGHAIGRQSYDATTTRDLNDMNGKAVLKFTTDIHGLKSPSVTIPTTSFSLVAVMRLRETGVATIVGDTGGSSGSRVNFAMNTDANLRFDFATAGGTNVVSSGVDSMATDGSEAAVVWASYSSVDSTAAVGKNGNALSTENFTITHKGSVGLQIGSQTTAATDDDNSGAMDLAALLVIGSAGHGTDIAGVAGMATAVAALRTLYGI